MGGPLTAITHKSHSGRGLLFCDRVMFAAVLWSRAVLESCFPSIPGPLQAPVALSILYQCDDTEHSTGIK